MFAEPTIEDYSDRIEWLLDKHRSLTAAAVSQIEREASAKGRYQSSSTIVGIFDAVDTQLNVAVDAAPGELSRAARISDLDETRLRELTHERLRAFATQMKSAAKPDKLRTFGGTNSVIDDRLSGIDTALAFKLRQFDVGFLVPEEPDMRPPEEPAAVVDTASGNGGSEIDPVDFEARYGELVEDVRLATFPTYELKLSDWFQFLDASPISRHRIEALGAGFDFSDWYAKAMTTVGSRGDGKLAWSRDRQERLSQYLALFRHLSNKEEAYIDFSTNFLWAGTDFDDMIAKINDQLFRPFSRDLLKDIVRNFLPGKSGTAVPASDRIVALVHNSDAYRAVMDQLAELETGVATSNEIGSADPDIKERLHAEVSAGRALMRSASVRVGAITAVLKPTLDWIAKTFANSAVGILAKALLRALASLIGWTI